jgi:hypothetical protein
MYQWYFVVERFVFLRVGEERPQASDLAQTVDSVFNLFNFFRKVA